MADFFVDPDISKARTLDKAFYTSASLFQAAREKVFAGSWQFIGDSSLAGQGGDVYPFTLLQDYLNEPLVLTRDKNNSLHLLSNVCTHRGNLVVDQPCTLSNLRCRYHGRLFRLDGHFLSMPEFKEVKGFPAEVDNLTELPLFQWGPLLFTSLNPQFGADAFLHDMMDRLSWLPLEEFVFKPALSREFIVKAHWALYCENYLEGFHIPFVHAGLNAVIDFGNYTTELYSHSSLQLGISKGDDDCFDLPRSSPDFGKKVAAYYYFIFPNLMFNFYPWGLSVNLVQPINENATRVSFLTYLWDEAKFNSGAGSNLDTVEMEDEEVVENVQRGIRSRFYEHGRYSVTREQGTHHFHRMVAAWMQ